MNIVIGIGDDPAENQRTINFLARIGLLQDEHELTLAYVFEKMKALDEILGASDLINNAEGGRYWEVQKAWAEERMDAVRKQIEKEGAGCASVFLEGFISNELAAYSRKRSADLVVIGSSDKGPLEGIMVGSVGRKLLVASECSLLIVKDCEGKSPVKAVLATDHSAYGEDCLPNLLQFPRTAFKEIVVTSVIDRKTMRDLEDLPKGDDREWDRISDSIIQGRNRRLVEKLATLGSVFKTKVLHGDVHQAIGGLVKDEEADLLIVSAQGHGFMERLLIGSTSMKLALSQKKSVLVLRRKTSMAPPSE